MKQIRAAADRHVTEWKSRDIPIPLRGVDRATDLAERIGGHSVDRAGVATGDRMPDAVHLARRGEGQHPAREERRRTVHLSHERAAAHDHDLVGVVELAPIIRRVATRAAPVVHLDGIAPVERAKGRAWRSRILEAAGRTGTHIGGHGHPERSLHIGGFRGAIALGRANPGLDVLRGVVIALMVIDHVRYFLSSATFDPTDPARTTAALFFTRWVTHFCAPVFMLLAGAGAYLSLGRGRSRRDVSWFLLTRGFWLLVLELTVARFGWQFNLDYGFSSALVFWALGWSMIALAAMVWLPGTGWWPSGS